MTVTLDGQLSDLREDQASRVCAEFYFEPLSIAPLVGYADRTFRVEAPGSTFFVLKLATGDEEEEAAIELQHRVLELLVGQGETSCPRPVASRRGQLLETWEFRETPVRVRMLTFVAGVPLASLPTRPAALLRDFGGLLGRLDRILAELDPGPDDRFMEWDIARIAEMPDLSRFVKPGARRRQVEAILSAYLAARETRHAGLRRSLIHGDANDHNVIVTSSDASTARISGLIDFGDLMATDTVVDLAVAMAYCGLGAAEPWQAALPVLEGFVAEHPLNEDELEMLFPSFCARLALSVSMSSRQRARGQADEYALISEAPAWAAVEWISDCDASFFVAMAHRVAGEANR